MHLYPLLLNSVLMACSNCIAHCVFLQRSGRHNTHLTNKLRYTLLTTGQQNNITKKKTRVRLVVCIMTRFCSVTAITVISVAC